MSKADLSFIVFDQFAASSIPDRLSDFLYQWRGIATWPSSEATVHTCRFVPDSEIPGYGNYQVSFSYRGGNEVLGKSIGIGGSEKSPPYSSGETFLLQYDPKRPSRYYCATHRSRSENLALVLFFVVAGLAGTLLAAVLYSKE